MAYFSSESLLILRHVIRLVRSNDIALRSRAELVQNSDLFCFATPQLSAHKTFMPPARTGYFLYGSGGGGT